MSVFLDSQCDLPLFTQRAPSVNGSITSVKAADSLGPVTLNALQRQVLALLQATPGGLTDEEMQQRLEMNPSTQRPRRIELARRGLVVEAGTRKTASGRMAVVWQATAASR
jgi:transcription initiation factor IIE alpha subunit